MGPFAFGGDITRCTLDGCTLTTLNPTTGLAAVRLFGNADGKGYTIARVDAVYGSPIPTPEPSAWLLWATALAVLVVGRVMRRQSRSVYRPSNGITPHF